MESPPGSMFLAATRGAPAIVLVHEWWGLNAHITNVAHRFVHEGISVYAVDLYEGQIAVDTAACARLMGELKRPRALELIGAAKAELEEEGAQPQKIGVVGFCMGGGFAINAAAVYPFAACVPFYGIGPEVPLQQFKAKVLGHYANIDEHCEPAQVDALEKRLIAAHIPTTFHRYEAHHAFFNDTRPEVYSAKDAAVAWHRTVAFLRETLS